MDWVCMNLITFCDSSNSCNWVILQTLCQQICQNQTSTSKSTYLSVISLIFPSSPCERPLKWKQWPSLYMGHTASYSMLYFIHRLELGIVFQLKLLRYIWPSNPIQYRTYAQGEYTQCTSSIYMYMHGTSTVANDNAISVVLTSCRGKAES